ncbi:MAG: gliding motility lipoprotein GldH [Chitinophagaceae bacterium]|nr:gliding motility lipoprotein GldH [Chitinophagaceae bacterium]
MPNYNWQSNFTASGAVSILDTASAYNLYVVLRHTDAYKYNNIWVQINVSSQGDTLVNQKLDLSLASDATGWEGVGMNDIWEVRKLITVVPFKFKKKGEYKYNIAQIMRDNPLPNVMSAGIRVEKVKF